MSPDAHNDSRDGQHDHADEVWQPFERVINDQPYLALLRTDWSASGPDRDKPLAIIVTLTYPPRDNGLPTPDVFTHVRAADDAVTSALQQHCSAICVGTLMGGGARTLYFYAPNNARAKEAVASVSAPGVTLTLHTQPDPAWERVVDDAWPSPEEMRWNADKSVLDQLEEAGDDMASPRPIEHLAVFPDKSAASRFIQWLREEGFELQSGPDRHDDEWLVEFTQVCPPDLDEIFEQTSAASQVADELGGSYDGWQCRVIKRE